MSEPLGIIIERYKKSLDSIMVNSIEELSNAVQIGTPVDSGKARGNWKSNAPIVAGKLYTFHNSLSEVPYIRRLEYGHSHEQAPDGFLRINVARWPQIVSKHARESK